VTTHATPVTLARGRRIDRLPSGPAAVGPRGLLGFRAVFPVVLEGELFGSPEHLGVGYLVSILRSFGATCRIVEIAGADDLTPVADDVAAWSPHLVGLSLTMASASAFERVGKALPARLGARPFFVAGGPLATFRGAALLEHERWQWLDALVVGEAEETIVSLASQFFSRGDLTSVPNLVFRFDGGVKHNARRAGVSNLDILPFPARDQFQAHGQLLSESFSCLRVSTSRGCTSACTFCNAPHAGNTTGVDRVWRGATAARVVDEVEALHIEYGCDSFEFVDSTFEDPGAVPAAKARVADIADQILRRELDIHFACCMQARNWTDDDGHLLDRLCDAGLERVLVGVESGHPDDLVRWNKRSTVSDNERVLRLLGRRGVYVSLGYICLHPYSSLSTVEANLAFLGRTVGHVARHHCARLELYPGASIVHDLRTDELLLPAFDDTHDAFAYRYRDPDVARLALALQQVMAPDDELTKRAETLDRDVHVAFTRRARQGVASEVVATGRATLARHRRDLTRTLQEVDGRLLERTRNHDLSDRVVGRARRDVEGALSRAVDELSHLHDAAFQREGVSQ
jgi:anaerobic magnesium-protoporphyrin IX monomethyl ester cyclase